MKNFEWELKGPRNGWKGSGTSLTLYSGGWEIFWEKDELDKNRFLSLTAHLWMFGFQVFEFVFSRKNHSSM